VAVDRRRGRELFLLAAASVMVLLASGAVRFARQGTLSPGDFAMPAAVCLAAVGLHVVTRRAARRADPVIAPIALLLAGLGHAMVDRLAPKAAVAQTGWAVLGIALAAGILLVVRKPYQLADYKYLWGIAGILLFLSPIFVGTEIGGSRLWIRFAGLSLQPSEFGKICLVLFFAAYLAEKGDLLATGTKRLWRIALPEFRHFGPLVAIWLVSLAVLVFEKDLGSSLLFFAVFVGLLYLSTGRGAYALAGTGLFGLGAWAAYHAFAHVRTRVDVWLDPWRDISGKGYQIAQSLFAIASGGVTGTGLGRGMPYRIPAAPTDFVFSAVAEELGLVGGSAVLAAYAVFVFRAFAIAASGRSRFTQLAAAGLALAFGMQALLIVGGVIKLVPLTGITLPFMSQGGSSLVANWIIVGLLLRFSDDAEEPA
jgi:cell division protein FtsW (lipid II flippase)